MKRPAQARRADLYVRVSRIRLLARVTDGVDFAVQVRASVSHDPGSKSGVCFARPHSSRSPPLAPQRSQPLCSSASQLLWRSQTSHGRASSATAPRLPDAGQRSTNCEPPLVDRETSRFPYRECACMPGSSTTPGRPSACVGALGRIAFRYTDRSARSRHDRRGRHHPLAEDHYGRRPDTARTGGRCGAAALRPLQTNCLQHNSFGQYGDDYCIWFWLVQCERPCVGGPHRVVLDLRAP